MRKCTLYDEGKITGDDSKRRFKKAFYCLAVQASHF